jgi:predicted Ser/Thr protein kinase
LEIGHSSIYADPDIQATLLQAGPVDSQAETRRVAQATVSIGGKRYEIREEIGRGGMGVVVRAYDRDLQRDVAIKLTRADRTGSHDVTRFVEEAQITGQLSHPNIVPVHELAHEPNGRTFFAMKLVEGHSLAQMIRKFRKKEIDFPLSRRLYIFNQLLNSMAYAHDRGVIHRDLKPDNVMVGDYGEVLLMDWGLAKISGKEELPRKVTTTRMQTPGSQTIDGAVIGTPAYMPPEQARGEREKIDERSDIYSLGAILYELLCLHPPYAAASASSLIEKVIAAPPPPPGERNPASLIPHGLEKICLKCLSVDPDDRFETVKELQDALEEYESEVEQSADEGVLFPLLGKLFAFTLVSSVFLGVALFLVGAKDMHLRFHLVDPGIFSGFIVLGLGTLAAWVRITPKLAFDATHSLLFWRRAGLGSGQLRGYYSAEAARRAKWMYIIPVDLAAAYAIITGSTNAAIVCVQMLGGALLCVLAINSFEHGVYRKLDILTALPGQDRRDRISVWGAIVCVLVLAGYFMHQSDWVLGQSLESTDFRRGTLMLHLVGILAGVWTIAIIGHPVSTVNAALKVLFSRKITDSQRTLIAPMARTFGTNALLFGTIGSCAWLGLIAPGVLDSTSEPPPIGHYLMGLTPLWGGILWNWYFRFRGGKIDSSAADEVVKRFNEYRKEPETPARGFSLYMVVWTTFVLVGIAATIALLTRY